MPSNTDRKCNANVASSSSSSPTSNNETVPLRQLLTPRVLLAIANYAMLAILDISLGALQPLYYSTPISLGGLGFSPAKIGLVMGMFGILNGILQGLFFSRIVGLVGLRRTFLISMGAFAPLFAMFPVINLVARARDVKVEVWALLVAQLLIWVIMDMSYGKRV
jgi:MFS family permease